MNDATLDAFRAIAAAMQTEPTDWEWVGPHLSQRMFGISQARAEGYAKAHGGTARQMPTPDADARATVRQMLADWDALTPDQRAAALRQAATKAEAK